MFAVVWTNAALDELADIWVAATPALRDRIEAAVLRLGNQLASDPTAVGESRDGNRRVVFDAPIAIICRVETGSQSVLVTHVWRYGR
jgi:plasmid stabilization system protein ParE